MEGRKDGEMDGRRDGWLDEGSTHGKGLGAAPEGGEESGPSWGELSVFHPGPVLLAWKLSNKGHSLP